jgi:hypothetical protein|tara:strand:- start:2216 stop:2917 length:702 start_codon:yes stop_codon:yes gene_type:complete
MKDLSIAIVVTAVMLFIFGWLMDQALADNDVSSSGATDNDQTNTSGSNTAITGGYNSEATTNYQSGSSSSTTTNNDTTNNAYTGDSRTVNPSNAPALSNMSQDVCTIGIGLGGSSFSFSASIGTYKRDLNCERLKLAKALHDMNMKVAAISLLCQNPMVFSAMHHAGSYCPYNSKIGQEAKAEWEKYGILRPDYEEYVKTLRITEEIDNEILEEIDEGQIINYSGGTISLSTE